MIEDRTSNIVRPITKKETITVFGLLFLLSEIKKQVLLTLPYILCSSDMLSVSYVKVMVVR